MISLRVVVVDEKRLALRGVDPFIQQCLFELPEILRLRDRPAARDRLFQDLLPHDAEANEEWHKLMDDELHYLFAGAEEIVVRDLTGLSEGEVVFPLEHLPAWMNALNQARLILAAIHQINEADMDRRDFNPADPKHEALVKVHVLGYLLQLLVERA